LQDGTTEMLDESAFKAAMTGNVGNMYMIIHYERLGPAL
jgi:hypothetical protein